MWGKLQLHLQLFPCCFHNLGDYLYNWDISGPIPSVSFTADLYFLDSGARCATYRALSVILSGFLCVYVPITLRIWCLKTHSWVCLWPSQTHTCCSSIYMQTSKLPIYLGLWEFVSGKHVFHLDLLFSYLWVLLKQLKCE